MKTYAGLEGYWIDCSSVVNILHDGLKDIDGISAKKYKINRELSKNCKEKDNKTVIPFSNLIQYAYNERHKSRICQLLRKSIEERLVGTPSSPSILDIYRDVAQGSIYDRVLEGHCRRSVNTKDLSPPTLYTEHQCHFTPEQWHRIALFEWHFSQKKGVMDSVSSLVDTISKLFLLMMWQPHSFEDSLRTVQHT